MNTKDEMDRNKSLFDEVLKAGLYVSKENEKLIQNNIELDRIIETQNLEIDRLHDVIGKLAESNNERQKELDELSNKVHTFEKTLGI